MATVIKLTDGTNTVTLTSGNYLVTEYEMGAPDDRNPDEVTETLGLLFVGSSYANNRTAIRGVETLLETAKRRQKWQAGPRVYLQVQWDGDAANWQTEVIDGRLEIPGLGDDIRRGKIAGDLIITRKFFETVDWTQLTLTNTNGTDDTSGLNVFTVNDGSGTSPNDRVNYLAIGTAEVTGSLPGALKLELQMAGGTASAGYWLGVNSYNDPENFVHWIEGENRHADSGGSAVASAAYSGGSAWQITASGTIDAHFTLGSATVQDCAGMPFRVLAGVYGNPPTGWAQPQVRDSSGVITIQYGDRVQLSGSTDPHPIDLGVLTIPPGEYGTSYGPLRLVTRFYTASTATLTIDWISLFPANTTRYVKMLSTVWGTADKVVLDESIPRAYITDGTVEYPLAILQGQPLTLEPEVASRIYMVAGRSGSVAVADYWKAKAWYKNRRWTI